MWNILSAGFSILASHIHRTRPVFRWLRLFQIQTFPGVNFEFFNRAVELLDLNCTVVLVGGNHLEKPEAWAPVPAADDGINLSHLLALVCPRTAMIRNSSGGAA